MRTIALSHNGAPPGELKTTVDGFSVRNEKIKRFAESQEDCGEKSTDKGRGGGGFGDKRCLYILREW